MLHVIPYAMFEKQSIRRRAEDVLSTMDPESHDIPPEWLAGRFFKEWQRECADEFREEFVSAVRNGVTPREYCEQLAERTRRFVSENEIPDDLIEVFWNHLVYLGSDTAEKVCAIVFAEVRRKYLRKCDGA